MGPGSAAHRRRGAAPRPGHGSKIHLRISIHIVRAVSRSRGTSCPSFAAVAAPKSAEGAGKAGRRLAPAVHCAKVALRKLHSGIQVKPNDRPSLRSGFTAYVVISPGSDALLPPSPCRWLMLQTRSGRHITTRFGAQTPGARTTRFCRTRAAPVVCARIAAHGVIRPATTLAPTPPASTTSHPAFVTIAIRPSAGLGWLSIR
jgi:hypothetical protein